MAQQIRKRFQPSGRSANSHNLLCWSDVLLVPTQMLVGKELAFGTRHFHDVFRELLNKKPVSLSMGCNPQKSFALPAFPNRLVFHTSETSCPAMDVLDS